jgi:hypothetical protein
MLMAVAHFFVNSASFDVGEYGFAIRKVPLSVPDEVVLGQKRMQFLFHCKEVCYPGTQLVDSKSALYDVSRLECVRNRVL